MFGLVALFDTAISFICLALFLIPVLAFIGLQAQKSARQKGANGAVAVVRTRRRLQEAAWVNLKWTAFSTLATFCYMVLASRLLPEYNTLWLFWGECDVVLGLYTISRMFPPRPRRIDPDRRLAGTSIVSSTMTRLETSESDGLFGSEM
jgi:hypothetical protein